MQDTSYRAIAIVGIGAILPDAPNAAAFWNNVKNGRYCISEVPRERWDPALYYDPDHAAPDKTYSKIGGWVREYPWEPTQWRLPLPPRVVKAMDESQRWAVACTREALEDYGYPQRPLDTERLAVILGSALGGEQHYLTSLRAYFPEYARELDASTSFAALPEAIRRDIQRELHQRIGKLLPEITEDSMPGELSNCLAGRVANLFNFRGPNYTADAACASAMAAISSAAHGLVEHDYDIALAGGVDRNMGPSSFIKFCKIGALSATGTRPYAEGADGFVMGEGAAIFLLKRLADAERDHDKIYAVLRGIAGSSDGKGKGITAPNPAGQKLAVRRAWENAGLSPATAGLIEGHGTSTKVGDVVEVESIAEVLRDHQAAAGSVALGSVKSNIGHLKGAAGAAGFLKLAMALHEKVLPPSVNCPRPNPDIDFARSPLYVNTELRPWTAPADGVRRGGLSAFGFGGTNFHAVLEEYIPNRLKSGNGNGNGRHAVAIGGVASAGETPAPGAQAQASCKTPLRGALLVGGTTPAELAARLRTIQQEAASGRAPAPAAPFEADLRAPQRVAIDYGDAAELADKAGKALKALAADQPAVWKALRAQGIFRGHGPAPKVAFLYTGQGSQYVNMMQELRKAEPIVAQTFAEADQALTAILGKPLSEFIFVDGADEGAVGQAEIDLRQTAITQPAVIATDMALTRLAAAYGIEPDMAMGHSVGEYGAMAAAGALPFADAMEAVAARGREMTRVSFADNGRMAAVFAPIAEVERILKTIDGYVVPANINSNTQAVIGGSSPAVEQAIQAFLAAGYNAVPLAVSHAFHTSIVAPASVPFRELLSRLRLQSPRLPIISNVDGTFYPTGPNVVPAMLDTLAKQIASPVQFIKGLETLYAAGARVFVEMGPKKALHGFAEDVLGGKGDVLALFTNHPKIGDIVAFNQALCGLYASGLGRGRAAEIATAASQTSGANASANRSAVANVQSSVPLAGVPSTAPTGESRFAERGPATAPVVVTGGGLGLPGTERVFDDANIARILRGEQFIDVLPTRLRKAQLEKNITRLVKTEDGAPRFETLTSTAEVIRLAGRGGQFELDQEFGVPGERLGAMDQTTRLALAAGLEALRDAGIPLVLHYKKTSLGTQLPDRWMLPEEMRDDTGIIFGSAYPGANAFADELKRFYEDQARRQELATLESLRDRGAGSNGAGDELNRRIEELKAALAEHPFVFDRRFALKVLAMGHSQLAEFIGARGPNTQVNCACASMAQGLAIAEDWIHAGRCRRVIVVTADDVTSEHLMGWIGTGFLATGAAATDEALEDAALPFDRRRHGLLLGMGAAALVVERADAARERGVRPICEVLGTLTANSAFHATRLDVQHIGGLMEKLVAKAEATAGISRRQIAPQTVFVSHETYTPARGGSASAEINALRSVFGPDADRIVIANTKGMTGHAMAAGIEEVVAVKILETGCVPPVANFKEIDPELGALNLSKGGAYPVEYALRLGAGFGSQICMTLLRWVKPADGARARPNALGYAHRIADADAWSAWLKRISKGGPAELEVVHRTLRLRDQAAAARTATAALEARPAAPAKMQAMAAVAAAAPAMAPVPPKTPVAAAVAVPASAPAPVPVAAPSAAADPVEVRILELVVEKTGYPKEMLDLDLDLEADLGVDTVKQAELLASIRGVYDIPRDENLKLRDFPTLRHVIGFVYNKRPDLKTAQPVAVSAPASVPTPVAPAVAAVVAAPAAVDPVEARILELVVDKTGYPKEMLDLDLDLEADLGVDTVKQAELLASIRGAYDIPRDENLKLRDFPTLRHVIGFVYNKRPDLKTAQPVAVAAPASVPTLVAPVAAVVAAPAAVDPVEARILELVVDKTGYPKEMLDLDLDLEADLGVDTVKQAELLASIRGAYDIPRDENLKLRDFPTLRHVIGFVYNKRPDLAAAKAAAPTTVAAATAPAASALVAAAPAAPVSTDPVQERILDLVVDKTGYPKEMLDLDLDLEADLGVDTVKQAELLASIRGVYDIPRDENLKLRDFPTLRHVIGFVYNKRPDLAAAKAAAPVAAVPPPAAAPVPVAAAAVPASTDPVQERILDLVVEKTGYPKEMLDLDLDLEADLGVDTVKQAELLASIRGLYNIPRDESLKLRDFPTLRHVIGFAHDKIAALGGTPVSAPAATEEAAPAEAPKAAATPVLASLEAANSVARRVPVPAVRPVLAATKATGITLGNGSRVVLMPDQNGVADALTARLRELGVEVLRIEGTPDAETLTAQLKAWIADGAVQGVYWLPALDDEGPLGNLDAAGWIEALRVRVKSLYTTMRTLYEQVAVPGSFLVSATRMGGQHGYGEQGATAPLGGAVTGFTKTYKRERPEVLVKVVDFETSCEAAKAAELLVEETLRDPGAVEIGYQGGQRWTVGLCERPAADGQPGMELNKETVFVITGAAGGIVSAITGDLAAASGGVFYLLDLVPEPDPANPDLQRFTTDREGLKRDLIARIQASGERPTPARIEKELAALERAQAAWKAIETVRLAGGTAHYCAVNLNDAEAVAKVIEQVRERSGRIDVLLHAAGMERSHFLPDKEPREFDLVFDVKSNGWFNLLHAIGDMPLGATVAFSSIAGRFGNGGQADYSSANDLLCKISSSFRTTRPETRAIAIDWTAWGGIGMATRGSIPKMMELAGIDMLPPEAGVPTIRRELTAGGTRGEIVVAQRLGILLQEFEAAGGLDPAAAESAEPKPVSGPMLGKLTGVGLYSGLTVETALDPKAQAFLYDHQIDGTPVLPGVMGMEGFAEASLALRPGWQVAAIEDVSFLAPFKFYRNKPRAASVQALVTEQKGSLVADCRLIGQRTIKKQAEPEITVHFTGRVRLSEEAPVAAVAAAPAEPSGSVIEAVDIYRVYFHGPAYQVLDQVWRDGDRVIGRMSQTLPVHHQPAELPTAISPLLSELCFQTAGIWEMGMQDRMGLPASIRELRLYRKAEFAEGPLFAVVTPAADGSFDAEVVDNAGNRYLTMLGYRTVALPYPVSSEAFKVLEKGRTASTASAAD